MKFRVSRLGLCLLPFVIASGCGMPPEYQIRKGQDPGYEDDGVRFRTTYYFRVIDKCLPETSSETAIKPRIDSLYRFTLTGKANALAEKVQFESGVLRASQIDPYGVRIETPEAIQSEDESTTEQTENSDKDSKDADQSRQLSDTRSEYELACSEKGASSSRGFQLWGPQGWRDFDPDERLVMAMSASAEPLVSQLQRVAYMQEAARAGGFDVDVRLSREDNRVKAAKLALKQCDVKALEVCVQNILDAYQAGAVAQ